VSLFDPLGRLLFLLLIIIKFKTHIGKKGLAKGLEGDWGT
jgi:hypothetical protein